MYIIDKALASFPGIMELWVASATKRFLKPSSVFLKHSLHSFGWRHTLQSGLCEYCGKYLMQKSSGTSAVALEQKKNNAFKCTHLHMCEYFLGVSFASNLKVTSSSRLGPGRQQFNAKAIEPPWISKVGKCSLTTQAESSMLFHD